MSGRTEATRRSAQVLLAILVALPMTADAQAFNQLCTINSLNFAAAANQTVPVQHRRHRRLMRYEPVTRRIVAITTANQPRNSA
jgi:hypothetical protein